MRLRSTIHLALRRLRRRPVRSFLLLQGTVWGVAVAILPVAVLEGSRAAARANATTLGVDRLSIAADPTAARETQLVRSDVGRVREALAERDLPATAIGAMRYIGGSPKSTVAGQKQIRLLATTPRGPIARGLELAQGRLLRPDDAPTTCVVEAGVARSMGLDAITPGMTIRVHGYEPGLQVVGVTKARPDQVLRTNDFGFDTSHSIYKTIGSSFMLAMGAPIVQDDWKRTESCVYIPLSGRADERVDWIFARVGAENVREAGRVAQGAFAKTDQAVIALHATVMPVVLSREVDRFNAVNVAMFLACLFMGAVVMANLGLLAALSRGREIAIRRVEGATRGNVAVQFLVEGFVLASIGSVLGCFLGMGLAKLRVALSPVTGFAWTFPWAQAAIAVGVALVLGLAASALPAWRAARQSPTRALADE